MGGKCDDPWILLFEPGEERIPESPPDDLNALLDLARIYEWNDLGATAQRRGLELSETVTQEVADGLAEALLNALEDLPRHDAYTHKLVPCSWAGPNAVEAGWLEVDETNPLSPIEYFSGERREIAEAMAHFCGGGPFTSQFSRW